MAKRKIDYTDVGAEHIGKTFEWSNGGAHSASGVLESVDKNAVWVHLKMRDGQIVRFLLPSKKLFGGVKEYKTNPKQLFVIE